MGRDGTDYSQLVKRVEWLEEGLRYNSALVADLLKYLNLEAISIPGHYVDLSYKILPIDNGKGEKK
jgi:hypothetical protein